MHCRCASSISLIASYSERLRTLTEPGNDKNDTIPTEDRIWGPEGGKRYRDGTLVEYILEKLSGYIDGILKRI